MSTGRRLHYSYEEYLACLEASVLKLEYCDGTIYAMAGATPAHAELAAARLRVLGQALLGRCRVCSSDLKVRVEASDLSTFPDATVVCGDVCTSARDASAVTNPSVLVEVTSRSTEDYDRGDKLSHYKQLPSLRAVILGSHRSRRLSCVTRPPEGWAERDFRPGETVRLDEPELAIDVDAIYAGVTLEGM